MALSRVGSYVQLDSLGVGEGIDQSSLRHDYLKTYEYLIKECLPSNSVIVIVGNKKSEVLGRLIAEMFPQTNVTLFRYNNSDAPFEGTFADNFQIIGIESVQDVLDHAVTHAQPDLLIEDGKNFRSEKIDILLKLLPWVSATGFYVVEDLHAKYVDSLAEGGGRDVGELLLSIANDLRAPQDKKILQGDEAVLVHAVKSVSFIGKLALIARNDEFLRVIGETMSDFLIEPSVAPDWSKGAVKITETEYCYPGSVSTNREDLGYRFRASVRLPPLALREYSDVTVLPRQVVFRSPWVLPETYRLFRNRRLRHEMLPVSTSWFARCPAPAPTDSLKGTYYHLDSEWLYTYGHAPTEILGRLWAWEDAVEKCPNIRVLLHKRPGAEPPKWIPQYLAAAGIPEERLVFIDRPTMVERLVGATPAFSNFDYAHPQVLKVWNTVGANLKALAHDLEVPERIFVSRDPKGARTCRNQDEVESLFASSGFSIIRPEKYSLPEQAAFFAGAKLIAGFGGSALINTIWSPSEVPRFLIAPDSYDAINEYLIAKVQGAHIHYEYQKSEISHEDGWTQAAYRSPFTADIARLAEVVPEFIDNN